MTTPRPEPEPPTSPSVPPPGLLRPGVVYVDDSETARATMRRALRARGVLLETFASWRALAERAHEAQAPALIAALLDVDLGHDDGTGLELAAALRVAQPGIALAFFSARPTVPVERLREFGAVFSKDDARDQAVAWLLAQIDAAA